FVKAGPDLLPSDLAASQWPRRRPPLLFETNRPGVFAVGDVRAGSVKRGAAAVGEGSVCIQLVHKVVAEERKAGLVTSGGASAAGSAADRIDAEPVSSLLDKQIRTLDLHGPGTHRPLRRTAQDRAGRHVELAAVTGARHRRPFQRALRERAPH